MDCVFDSTSGGSGGFVGRNTWLFGAMDDTLEEQNEVHVLRANDSVETVAKGELNEKMKMLDKR